MPLNPYFAAKMKVLEKFDSVAQAMADPESAKELTDAFHDSDMGDVPVGTVTEDVVTTREGSVGIRIYSPDAPDPRADVFVWAHGGGFAGGSIGMPEADTVARELAFRHGIHVVTVDYALSNGTTVTYPIPHRQVADVFTWVRENTSRWDAGGQAVALGGASAGANLAVGAVLELREKGEQLPAALLLAYPLLNRRLDIPEEREAELREALGLTRMDQSIVDRMFALYTGDNDAPFASAQGQDLTGFPRALTIVSEYDDLRPSGEAFHGALESASVDADLYLAAGMPHGHLDRTRLVPEVSHTVQKMAQFLRHA